MAKCGDGSGDDGAVAVEHSNISSVEFMTTGMAVGNARAATDNNEGGGEGGKGEVNGGRWWRQQGLIL